MGFIESCNSSAFSYQESADLKMFYKRILRRIVLFCNYLNKLLIFVIHIS